MNINALYELKERMEIAVIAGIGLIDEDFRLKRAIQQIEPLAKASPVFQKIEQMTKQLFKTECRNKAEVLLDTLAFVNAVLITQASVQVEGELQEIKRTEQGVFVQAPYRLLSPILEALRGTGGGRYHILKESHRLYPELFQDYRLKAAMVEDLNDSYMDIAQMLRHWLIEEGDLEVIPLLKNDFLSAGKRGMMFRIQILETLSGAAENDFYRDIYDKVPKEVQEEVVFAMAADPSNEEFLLNLAKTEKGNRKDFVCKALAKCGTWTAQEYLREIADKKGDKIGFYLVYIDEEWASDLVAEKLDIMLDRMISPEFLRRNREEKGETAVQFRALLWAAVGKTSIHMQEIYRKAAKMPQDTMKGLCPMLGIRRGMERLTVKETITEVFAELLAETILFTKNAPEPMGRLAEELYQTYGQKFLEPVFAFELLIKEKEILYQKYHSYFPLENDKTFSGAVERIWKKVKGSEKETESILKVFRRINYREGQYERFHFPQMDENGLERNKRVYILPNGISEKWYDLIQTYGEYQRKKGEMYKCGEIERLLSHFKVEE